jgi:hypothetical protein
MAVAASHPHRLGGEDTLTAHGHVIYAFPGWALALLYLAILGSLSAGVWVLARAARRMSRPGRIVVGLVAAWTSVVAVVVFLDTDRPYGDWRGGLASVAFVVLYGLIAAGIVWAVDRTARRLRASSPA